MTNKNRMDEFTELNNGDHLDVQLDLFTDDAHFETLWRCVRDGDLNNGGCAWGYTKQDEGVHRFDITTPSGFPRITYQIDDLKKIKTRQELIDLTNLILVQEKIAGYE